MRTSGSFALAATTALVFVLAGCSGAPGGNDKAEESPLSKYLSAAWGGDLSPEEQQKKMEDQQKRTEELVAKCMSKEGFEYKPNTGNAGMVFSSSDDVKWEPDDKKWVEKYGYGMVNSPYNEQAEEQPTEEYKDPNQKYVESLSESEQTAYSETLYGAPSEEAMNEDGSFEYNWEDGGCYGWAQHEIQGEDPLQADEFKELTEKMSALWSEGQAAPQYKELNAKWASCMADGGEPGFKLQQDAQQSISEEQQKIFEAAYGDQANMTPEQMEQQPDPNKSPEMKKLGEREIELALVDLECRKKTSYTEEARKIQFAIEEKFIADNKKELEAFKAAAEQSK